VLDHPLPAKLNQMDLIIWAPFPVPPIFEVDGFGLVPRSSAFGVIEVKKSGYDAAGLELFIERAEARTIVSDPLPGVPDSRLPAIGVVCLLENAPSARLQELIGRKHAVAIYEKTDTGVAVRDSDVFTFVEFLMAITRRYYRQASSMVEFGVNFPVS
jgi:hypothetical protein